MDAHNITVDPNGTETYTTTAADWFHDQSETYIWTTMQPSNMTVSTDDLQYDSFFDHILLYSHIILFLCGVIFLFSTLCFCILLPAKKSKSKSGPNPFCKPQNTPTYYKPPETIELN